MLGVCHKTQVGPTTGMRGARIEILPGLGPTRFGHTVSHELGHALIHLQGRAATPPELEEGVCELIAAVWLTQRATPTSVLRRIWASPDPVYGGTMRTAVAAARRHTVAAVLHTVLNTGRLPHP